MKNIHYIVVIALFSFTTLSPAWANEQGRVYGTITKKAGKPLRKALIRIGHHFSFTDSKGSYRIKNVAFGKQTMIIERDGKILKKIRIMVDKRRIKHDEVLE